MSGMPTQRVRHRVSCKWTYASAALLRTWADDEEAPAQAMQPVSMGSKLAGQLSTACHSKADRV